MSHDTPRTILALLLCGLGVTGCGSRAAPGGDGGGLLPDLRRPPDSRGLEPAAQPHVMSDLDLLVVMDSSSMGVKPDSFTKAFPALLEALRHPSLGLDDPQGSRCSTTDRSNCRIPDLHLGVVSTDLGAGGYSLPSCETPGGDGGKLQSKPLVAGCTPPSDPYISYVDGTTNVPDWHPTNLEKIAEAFGCIGLLGSGGCGFEHPLEAARRALDPTLNVNPGFLRKDATLAILWLTDEDDCSATKPQLFDPAQQGLTDPLGPLTSFRCFEFGISCDKNGRQPGVRHSCVPGFDWLFKVEEYQQFFANLKPAGRLVLFALAGPTSPVEVGIEGSNPVLKPSCQSQSGNAVPAIRLAAVVQSFGANGLFNPAGTNACSPDYTPALRALGERLLAIGQ